MTFGLFFQVADTFAAPLNGFCGVIRILTGLVILGVLVIGVSLPLGIFLDHVTDLGPYAY